MTKQQFAETYVTLKKGLQIHAQRVGVEEEIVQDLVQISWTKAWNAIDSWRGEASFKTWITSILNNVIREHYRSWHVRHITPFDYVDNDELGRFREKDVRDVIDPSTPNVDEEIDHKRNVVRLRAMVQKLPEPYRLAVTAWSNGASSQELADRLGLPVTTAKTHVHRGLQTLKARAGK